MKTTESAKENTRRGDVFYSFFKSTLRLAFGSASVNSSRRSLRSPRMYTQPLFGFGTEGHRAQTPQHHPEAHPRSQRRAAQASRDRTGGSGPRRTRRSLPDPTLRSA